MGSRIVFKQRRQQRSQSQQGLDRPPLVHGAVAFGDISERDFEVEDTARIDLAFEHQIHEIGQEAADGSRS